METKRCYRCSSSMQMPDGNSWCGITNKPESGIGCNYSSGTGKMYKPEVKEVQKEKAVIKTAPIPKVKSIPVKQKPLSSSKKILPPQGKMF